MKEGAKLIIDIKSIQKFLSYARIDLSLYLDIVDQHGIIMWDSSYGGYEPKVIDDIEAMTLIDRAKLTEEERGKLDEAIKNGDFDIFDSYREDG